MFSCHTHNTKDFAKSTRFISGYYGFHYNCNCIFSDHVPTIGTAYGTIPSTLPQFGIPEITVERIKQLIGPAFVIAMLGGIESLLSAVVADGMTNSKHNSNKELIGQGIANIVTPLFGGIPATGAIARTATNIRSGAVSPMSGVIHGDLYYSRFYC